MTEASTHVAVWKSLRGGGYEIPVDQALEVVESLEDQLRSVKQELGMKSRSLDYARERIDALNDDLREQAVTLTDCRDRAVKRSGTLEITLQYLQRLTTSVVSCAANGIEIKRMIEEALHGPKTCRIGSCPDCNAFREEV